MKCMKDEKQAREHHIADTRHTSRQASSEDEDGGQIREEECMGENVLADEMLSQLQEEQKRIREEQKKRLSQQQEAEPSLPPRTNETYTLKRRDEYCPRCGSILVERHGPYGGFLGCAAYPTCDYTRGRSRGLGRSYQKMSFISREHRRRGPKL